MKADEFPGAGTTSPSVCNKVRALSHIRDTADWDKNGKETFFAGIDNVDIHDVSEFAYDAESVEEIQPSPVTLFM